ncbi:heme utilization protein HutZ [Dongshaea marina]|uniref:heme utilization protein HutZ n=1 Tax=Dongshaea marina TaxID=2047966 RepID=UPI000D3E8342|nr:heme utilization protein HutZ [Dongshaea marina]
MTEKQQRLQQRLGPEIESFIEERKTLQLATLTPDGKPSISYAPFVCLDGKFYVLLSDIARHGRNLQSSPQLSLMMIEDESGAKQLYARRRLTYEASASLIQRDSQIWVEALEALQQRFGEIIEGLSRMADFKLYCLEPLSGRYVKGFGQAFEISGSAEIDWVHLKEGHKEMA